mgnify:CR=1 FL=1
MKKAIFILSLILIFMMTATLYAEEEKAYVKSEIGVGYHVIGVKDSRDRVGEYDEMESTPYGTIDLKTIRGKSNFSLKGEYKGENDQKAILDLNAGRFFDLEAEHTRLHHRLDHDRLFIKATIKDNPHIPHKSADCKSGEKLLRR